ncbi:MAG: AsmA family protein [Nitrospirae bacterium]|nr:AsmA family protein [Nitrospirota bacterium]MDE3040490.1 AsmA family protein [Nitrospirota bacterium]MDE3048584.1 AsmA family protein [Nitrospirota bacterium]
MKIVIGLLIGVVLLVGVILSLPFLIDLNKYQDRYKPLIEEALNRKVQLQDIRLTIWPRIGARVAGFVVLDDPAFGSTPFTSLTSLDVGVKLMPLLSGKVEVEDITLRDPVITVIKNERGVLNVSTIGRTGVAVPKTPSRAPIPSPEGPLKILALLAVDRVSITGGKLTYRDLSVPKPTEYILQDMEVLLQSVRLGQTPSLHVGTLVQPLNLPVRLDGTFGPLKESADIDAINLQLAVGKTDFTITGKTVGRNASLNISAPVINTANLPVALPLQTPVEVNNLQVAAEVQGQDVLLQNFSFQLFDGQVTAQGRVTSGSGTPPFTGKMTIQGMQLGPALNALATTRVSISGTAGADLGLQGRGFSMPDLTKSLEGTGHMAVKDGKIEGVNLLQEAISILKVVGVSLDDAKATVFSTIETDLAMKQGIVHVQRLLMDSHDFQATGGGTIGFDQTLNLTVNLNLSQEFSQKLARSSPLAKLAMKEDRLSLPLVITGTAQAPSYALNMKGLTGRVQEQVRKKAEEAVGGLLKGTTKPEDIKQQGQEMLKGLLGR